MRSLLAVIIVALVLGTFSSASAAPNGEYGPHGHFKDGPIGWITMGINHYRNRQGYIPVYVPNKMAPNGRYRVKDVDKKIAAGCYVGRDSLGVRYLLSNIEYKDGSIFEFIVADEIGHDRYGNTVYQAMARDRGGLEQHLYLVPTFVPEGQVLSSVSFTNVTRDSAEVYLQSVDWQHVKYGTFSLRPGCESILLIPPKEYCVSWSDQNALLPRHFWAPYPGGNFTKTSVYGKPIGEHIYVNDRRGIEEIPGLVSIVQ